MDIDAEHADVFDEVYDTEHIPNLLAVPGVLGVTRYVSDDFEVSLGGDVRQVGAAAPRHYAIYALESPEVLVSEAWAAAVERGRWPGEVRPFTSNRKHMLLRSRKPPA